MAIEVFNRFEHKYLMDKATYEQVLFVMDKHMELDAYNPAHKPYTIANLYYDTADDALVRTSLQKPAYKEKLRLRAYGVPKEGEKVYLEIKKKVAGLVNKRRTALMSDEAYAFTASGDMPQTRDYMNGQVLKEIAYFLSRYDLSPKLYLAYDRVAYFEKGNPDLRISFDTDIRYRRNDLVLEDGDFGEKLLADGTYLMEIKTSRAVPLWLASMLSALELRRESFSKYGAVYLKECADLPQNVPAPQNKEESPARERTLLPRKEAQRTAATA